MERQAIHNNYGPFGGAYVSAPLVGVVRKIGEVFATCIYESRFQRELNDFLATFAGRPTPLHKLRRFSPDSGAGIFVKREDVAYTGGNYINSAIGQCLLARRYGAHSVVCDTGSDHNGVATAASAAAALGLGCTIFMGRADHDAQAVMVTRMHALGARVQPIDSGSALLSEAVSAAYQAWMGCAPDVFDVSGTPVGPAPYPAIIRAFQSVIGRELQSQTNHLHRRTPAALVATLGGEGSVIGLFAPFIANSRTRLVVAQSMHGQPKPIHLRLGQARLGVLHGARTLVLQEETGAIASPTGLAPGLRYTGAPPEIPQLWEEGRIESVAVDEQEALATQAEIAETEGLLVSIESSHALHAARVVVAELRSDQTVVACINASDDGAVLCRASDAS